MKAAFLSALAATTLVAITGTHLLAQGPQTMSSGDMSRVQVTGTITKVDMGTGAFTIDVMGLPGAEGATELSYTPMHHAALSMYKAGDHVSADVLMTENSPKIESIGSGTAKEIGRYDLQAIITKIDQKSGIITIETTNIAHPPSAMTLSYAVAHPQALTMYHQGDRVLVTLIMSEDGPRVGWINSVMEPRKK